MSEAFLFKIWTLDRSEKTTILLKGEENLYENLILKASQKLKIDGEKLCLLDGTEIDEDEVLKLVIKETLILLRRGEKWKNWDEPSDLTSVQSMSSTVTYTSTTEEDTFNNKENAPVFSTNILEAPGILIGLDEQSNFFWHNYEIPLCKMPNLIQICEKPVRNSSEISEIVRFLVQEMRNVCSSPHRIPAFAFKIVCHKMVEKYPSAFKDMDDDLRTIGDGEHSLYYKLLDRNAYLNRPHKRKSPFSNSKRVKNARASCPDWNPKNLVSSDIIEDTQDFYLMDNNAKFNVFVAQRKYLNNLKDPPTWENFITKWPFMEKSENIIWHFKQMAKLQIDDVDELFIEKSKRIIQFYHKDVSNEDTTKESLKLLANHFKEHLKAFFYEENECAIENCTLPVIIEVDNENEKTYKVIVQKFCFEEVFKRCSQAVMVAFSLYYVLNIQYPKEISCTLEFIQRFYLKMHPDDCGTKSNAKNKKKVLNLINKIYKKS